MKLYCEIEQGELARSARSLVWVMSKAVYYSYAFRIKLQLSANYCKGNHFASDAEFPFTFTTV